MNEPTPVVTTTVPSSNFFKKHLGWIVTGFLTIIFWMQTCNLKKEIEEGQAQITQLELNSQTLQQKINKQGETIQVQEAIITTSHKALDNLTDTIFDLRNKDNRNRETIAYYKGITRTQIKGLEVPYLDTVAMKKFSDSILALIPKDVQEFMRDSMIQVPRTSHLSTPHLDLTATAKKQGITIDNLSLPDTLQLRFVERKGNLFRSPSVEVQYFHTNPYIINVASNSAVYKPKRKSFFVRVVLPVGIGLAGGLLISR